MPPQTLFNSWPAEKGGYCTRLGTDEYSHVDNTSNSVNRAIADEGGICRQLAILDATSGVNASLQADGSIAVGVTLGSKDTPESTIELEYGNVTNYELYVGPYISEGKFTRPVLARRLRDAVEHHDLFPNGRYEINSPHQDNEYTVVFAANLLFSRRRDSRPVETVVDEIKTLLDLRESL